MKRVIIRIKKYKNKNSKEDTVIKYENEKHFIETRLPSYRKIRTLEEAISWFCFELSMGLNYRREFQKINETERSKIVHIF